MLDRLRENLESLSLDAGQKETVMAIIDKAKADVAKAIEGAKDLEPRERLGKIREILQPVRQQVMDTLNETQREKFRSSFGEGFGRGARGGPDGGRGPRGEGRGGPGGLFGGDRGGPGGPPGGPRPPHRNPAEMVQHLRENLAKLDLKDDQKSKVESLLNETEKTLNDLRTQAEKQAAEMGGKFRAAMQNQRQQLDSILTDEQKQKLREVMPPPRPRDGERRGGPGGPSGPGGHGFGGGEGGDRRGGDGPPPPPPGQ